MSEKSQENLYHLILGLPEDVTSPNHYELLGLDARTGDPQVIRSAATDQNRKLLGWQNSDRYAEVRELTFEVIRARDVLLNDESRAAYDQTLGDWGILEDGPWIVEEPAEEETSGPLTVECPDCGANFKLRNRDLIGRRMPCPECGFRFKIRPAQKAAAARVAKVLPESSSDAELAELDNFDDMEDLPHSDSTTSVHRRGRTRERNRNHARRADRDKNLFDVEPIDENDEDYEAYRPSLNDSRSRRRENRRPKSRSRWKKAPSRTAKWPLVLGGLLMAAGVVVLTAIVVQQALSPSLSSGGHLAYLPAESRSFGYLRVAELSRSPFFQDHLTRDNRLRGKIDEFRSRTGMTLGNVETLAIGLQTNKPDLLRRIDLQTLPRARLHVPFVAVARANQDWNRAKLIGEHTQSATHRGETYHEFSPGGRAGERWALYLPDARTLIFGTVAEVKAAIDTNGAAPVWPAVESLGPGYPVVSVEVSDGRRASSTGPRPSGFRGTNANSFRSLGTGFLLENNQGRHVTFQEYDSESEAATAVEETQRALDELERMRSSNRRNGSRKGTEAVQHGRVVALIEGGRDRLFNPGDGTSIFAPLSLLAGLGEGAGSPASGTNAESNPIAGGPLVKVNTLPGGQQDGQDPVAARLDQLIANLHDRRTARTAARELAAMQPDPDRREEVAGQLEIAIQNGAHFDKQAAADALAVWGASENVPFLLSILDGDDVFLKRRVLAALGRLKDPLALPRMIAALKSVHTRNAAEEGLKHYGSEAEPDLLRALTASDWQTQRSICQVLQEVGTEQSLTHLDALAARGSIHVRSRAQSAANAIRNGKP